MQIRISEKMKFILLGLTALIGLIFVIFAVFFNHAILRFNGKTPFKVYVQDLKSVICTENPCDIVLAPGKYSVQISKIGAKTINKNVKLKFGQINSEHLIFETQPALQVQYGYDLSKIIQSLPTLIFNFDNVNLNAPINSIDTIVTFVRSLSALKSVYISNDAKFFIYDDGTKIYLKTTRNIDGKGLILPIHSGTPLSFSPDSSVIYFLKINPNNQKQALYKLYLTKNNNVDKNSSSEINTVQFRLSKPLVYFSRIIKNYQLKVNNNEKEVALLDLSNPSLKSIYLIDLNIFSKNLIMANAKISNFKFLSIDNSILAIENIADNPVLKNIFLIDSKSVISMKQSGLNQLPIFTELNNLTQRRSGEVIYPVSKFATTSNINEVVANTGFKIQAFNLKNQSKSLVYAVNNLNYPSRSEIDSDTSNINTDKTGLLMVIGHNIYQLNL